MKNIIISLILLFLLSNCTKPKTVFICGDHICVNKTEAEQYFEDNLSLEVKIIEKEKKKINLVELNLNTNSRGEKKINIFSKKETSENLKTLSNEEIKLIKKKIKYKKNKQKISKKTINKKYKIKNDEISKNENVSEDKMKKINLNNIRAKTSRENAFDVCTIIKKCSINEISKYLLNQGKIRDFPDITKRQ